MGKDHLEGQSRWRDPALKDVGRVDIRPVFEISSDIDGYPATTIVLKPLPGWTPPSPSSAIEKDLEELKAAAFPPGMNFEVMPLDSRNMVYAVVELLGARHSNTQAPSARS